MKKIIKAILLILWMYVIYWMSNTPGNDSGVLSSNLLRNIAIFFRASDIDGFILKYHGVFRKMAHFSEYFILGILMYINIKEYYKKPNIYILCIILCFLYAASDEIHQLFISGRYGSFIDVLIDTSGSATGSFIIHLVNMFCYQEKKL